MEQVVLESVSCPICGLSDGEEILSGVSGVLVECDCGLIYASKRVPADYLRELQADYVPSAFYKVEDDAFAARFKQAHMDLELLERVSDGGILFDLCAGSGAFIRCAKDRGWRVLGNDLSSTCCLLARHKFGVDLYNCSAEQLKFDKGGVDAFSMMNALEHLRDPVGTLKTIDRALNDGGHILVRVPIVDVEEAIKKPQLPQHLYNFNHITAERLMNVGGFTMVDYFDDGEAYVFVAGRTA